MYRGRFAPSPTGPLHFGSLVAAVCSYADARAHGGQWLVRIEDADEPRCPPRWADDILRTLERLGFAWHGPVVRQSGRKEVYREALEALQRKGLAYACACKRRETAGRPYPGTCRGGLPPGAEPRAWRFRAAAGLVEFEDRWQGPFAQDVERAVGDFIILRADLYFAYQFAVVVDDAAQGITHVVRGVDLLDSTPRQILLQRALGYPAPRYLHHPVVRGPDGLKLSKQNGAAALEAARDAESVRAALQFLGLAPPPGCPPREALEWAVARWPYRDPACAGAQG